MLNFTKILVLPHLAQLRVAVFQTFSVSGTVNLAGLPAAKSCTVTLKHVAGGVAIFTKIATVTFAPGGTCTAVIDNGEDGFPNGGYVVEAQANDAAGTALGAPGFRRKGFTKLGTCVVENTPFSGGPS